MEDPREWQYEGYKIIITKAEGKEIIRLTKLEALLFKELKDQKKHTPKRLNIAVYGSVDEERKYKKLIALIHRLRNKVETIGQIKKRKKGYTFNTNIKEKVNEQ